MAWFFGDSFDFYGQPSDAWLNNSYWDATTPVGSTPSATLVRGRYAGSAALLNPTISKTSGQNDAVHHFNFSYQADNVSGSSATENSQIHLEDGTNTYQCHISFMQNGDLQLRSGFSGSAIATWTGAIPSANTWYSFEIEVVINNTTGSITCRRDGNPSNDFTATGLNTRAGTAHNYANAIYLHYNNNNNTIDDFLWRSDPTSVAWIGDVRCYARRPASDARAQWTPSGSVAIDYPTIAALAVNTTNFGSSTIFYSNFTANYTGTMATVDTVITTAVTGNLKMALYAVDGTFKPTGAPLATSNQVTNPSLGTCTFTFASPPSLTQGTMYCLGIAASAGSGAMQTQNTSTTTNYNWFWNSATYASFPYTNPTLSGSSTNNLYLAIKITPTSGANAPMLADTGPDLLATYVSSNTIGNSDLYGLGPITNTPGTVVGVVTRIVAEKSDTGTRTMSLDLKSGSTTSSGATTTLSTSWSWLYRTDLVDPATSAAWTATAVNNLQAGPTLVA